jgi:hypothetical protein
LPASPLILSNRSIANLFQLHRNDSDRHVDDNHKLIVSDGWLEVWYWGIDGDAFDSTDAPVARESRVTGET